MGIFKMSKNLTTTTTENTNTDTNTSDTANNTFVEVQSDNVELVNSNQSIADSPNVKIVGSIVITLIIACAVLYLIQHFFSTLPKQKQELLDLKNINNRNENLLNAEKQKNNALESQKSQLIKELSEETNKVKLLNSNIESLKNKFDNDIKNNSNEFNNKIKNIERNFDNEKSQWKKSENDFTQKIMVLTDNLEQQKDAANNEIKKRIDVETALKNETDLRIKVEQNLQNEQNIRQQIENTLNQKIQEENEKLAELNDRSFESICKKATEDNDIAAKYFAFVMFKKGNKKLGFTKNLENSFLWAKNIIENHTLKEIEMLQNSIYWNELEHYSPQEILIDVISYYFNHNAKNDEYKELENYYYKGKEFNIDTETIIVNKLLELAEQNFNSKNKNNFINAEFLFNKAKYFSDNMAKIIDEISSFYINNSKLQFDNKNYEIAENLILTAIKFNNNYDLLQGLAIKYADIENYEKAYMLIKDCYEKTNNNYLLLNIFEYSNKLTNNYQEVKDNFYKAKDFYETQYSESTDDNEKYKLAKNISEIYKQFKLYKKAVSWYKSLYEIYNNENALCIAANMLIDSKDNEYYIQAKELLERTLKDFPYNVEAKYYLGFMYYNDLCSDEVDTKLKGIEYIKDAAKNGSTKAITFLNNNDISL